MRSPDPASDLRLLGAFFRGFTESSRAGTSRSVPTRPIDH
jgi:hypothetical protein